MPWTEKHVEGRAKLVVFEARKGADNLPAIHNTDLLKMDSSDEGETPDPLASVESTGLSFQERIKATSMDHLNKNPKHFQSILRGLYREDETGTPTTKFKVILLATDPLKFKPSVDLRAENAPKQHQQFLGEATVVKKTRVKGSTVEAIYTLRIQIIGAQVSELLKNDIQGLSLATAVASRETVFQKTVDGLTGGCTGSTVKNVGDINHVATVLTAADEISSGTDRGILRSVQGTSRSAIRTVSDLAHQHNLDSGGATNVGATVLRESTALNPLTSATRSEDVFIVNPNLTQPVAIIPLNPEVAHDAEQAVLASVALGVLRTFGTKGTEELAQVVKKSNDDDQVAIHQLRVVRRNGE